MRLFPIGKGVFLVIGQWEKYWLLQWCYCNYVYTTKTNSPGHGFRLQSTLSVRLPKHVPPLLSWMVLTLVLDFVSNPQRFAHDEKLVHVDKVQFSESDMIHHKKTSVLQYYTLHKYDSKTDYKYLIRILDKFIILSKFIISFIVSEFFSQGTLTQKSQFFYLAKVDMAFFDICL